MLFNFRFKTISIKFTHWPHLFFKWKDTASKLLIYSKSIKKCATTLTIGEKAAEGVAFVVLILFINSAILFDCR